MEGWTFRVSSNYRDGKWEYCSDSEKGVTILCKCSCGQTHTIKLDKNMALFSKEEVIDVEPLLLKEGGEYEDQGELSYTEADNGGGPGEVKDLEE